MAKVVDITEKLAFNENPIIKIKDKEFEVNADAETVLLIMGLINGDTPKIQAVSEAYKLIFCESDREEIGKFKLQYKDFEKLIMAAIDLVIGSDEEQGE